MLKNSLLNRKFIHIRRCFGGKMQYKAGFSIKKSAIPAFYPYCVENTTVLPCFAVF